MNKLWVGEAYRTLFEIFLLILYGTIFGFLTSGSLSADVISAAGLEHNKKSSSEIVVASESTDGRFDSISISLSMYGVRND